MTSADPAGPPASDRCRQLYESLQLRPGEDWPALLPMLLVKVAWETDRVLTENESLFLRDHYLRLIQDVVPQVSRLSPQAGSLYLDELLVRGELNRSRRTLLAAGGELLAWELGKRLDWGAAERYYDSMVHRVLAMFVYLPGFHQRLKVVLGEFQAAVDALLPCRTLGDPLPAEPRTDWRQGLWEERWKDFLLLPLAFLAARRQHVGARLPAVNQWEYPCSASDFHRAEGADRELCQDYATLLKKHRHALAEQLARGPTPWQLWDQQEPLLEQFSHQGYASREQLLACFGAVLRGLRYRHPWGGDMLVLGVVAASLRGHAHPGRPEAPPSRCRQPAPLRGLPRETAREPARPPEPAPAPPPEKPAAPPPARPAAVAAPALRQEQGLHQPPPVIAPVALATLPLAEALKAVEVLRVEDLEHDLEALTGNFLFADAVGPDECVAVVSRLPPGELWIAGDVHADLLTLANLFRFLDSRAAQGKPWSLVLLGDFIDRGGHDHPTLLYLLDRIRRHPGQVALLLGNHDEDLHWDEKTGRFRSTIEPAEYSEQLNALLDKETAPDDPRIRLARLAERLFQRLPRAIFLPGGGMLTHGGFPHTDRHEHLKTAPRPERPGLPVALYLEPLEHGQAAHGGRRRPRQRVRLAGFRRLLQGVRGAPGPAGASADTRPRSHPARGGGARPRQALGALGVAVARVDVPRADHQRHGPAAGQRPRDGVRGAAGLPGPLHSGRGGGNPSAGARPGDGPPGLLRGAGLRFRVFQERGASVSAVRPIKSCKVCYSFSTEDLGAVCAVCGNRDPSAWVRQPPLPALRRGVRRRPLRRLSPERCPSRRSPSRHPGPGCARAGQAASAGARGRRHRLPDPGRAGRAGDLGSRGPLSVARSFHRHAGPGAGRKSR